jgi:hypothetical protein
MIVPVGMEVGVTAKLPVASPPRVTMLKGVSALMLTIFWLRVSDGGAGCGVRFVLTVIFAEVPHGRDAVIWKVPTMAGYPIAGRTPVIVITRVT